MTLAAEIHVQCRGRQEPLPGVKVGEGTKVLLSYCACACEGWRLPAPPCRPSANSSIIFALNAGRSEGLRDETMPRSTTTSWSTQRAPAFCKSVFTDGYDVM